MATAFRLRKGESFLSVNWLEHFDSSDLSGAVQMIRNAFDAKGFRLRPNGRFAVVCVQEVKDAAMVSVGRKLSINHLPVDNDTSHAGIFGYTGDDLMIAVEIKSLVGREDVHPAIP